MHNKSCKNGCDFAVQLHLMSYASKNSDGTYSDADYIYKCTKIDRVITFDSTVYELGCATYNNECQNARIAEADALVAEVEKKVDEIEKIIPQVVAPVIAEPAVPVAEPVVVQPPVERVEPRFVPEPTVAYQNTTADVPINTVVVEKPEPDKPDVPKKRGRRPAIEASVVNPVVAEVPKE